MKKRVWATAFLFLASSVPSLAQVDTAWIRRYDGPGNAVDVPYALKVDGGGNVYITGYSTGSGTAEDFTTIKYAPNGDTLWVRYLNGPGNGFDAAIGVEVDGGGNVYVAGTTYWGPFETSPYYDISIIKYTPSGDTAWFRDYDAGYDGVLAMAKDGSGNVYVGGLSPANLTIKYLPNGDTLWARWYSGPGGSGAVDAIAVDAAGYVYVTGHNLGSGTDFDFATIKYTPNGDTLWVRRYNGPGNGDDRSGDIAVDASGNVYVSGYSLGSGTSNDYATIKYAPNGDTLWVRRYNGPGNGDDQPARYWSSHSLAVDNGGNVYVTGRSPGSGTAIDYATIKYAPSGDTLWVRRYNGPGNDDDVANALKVDSTGNVYVIGSSTGSGTTGDFATIKYDPNGDSLWVARYNGPGNGSDAAYALDLDANGNVYVTGFSVSAGGDADYATIKYIQTPSCAAAKGDVNTDGSLSPADVVAMLNCVYLGIGDCHICYTDVSCDGGLSPADVVTELNMVYLGAAAPC